MSSSLDLAITTYYAHQELPFDGRCSIRHAESRLYRQRRPTEFASESGRPFNILHTRRETCIMEQSRVLTPFREMTCTKEASGIPLRPSSDEIDRLRLT